MRSSPRQMQPWGSYVTPPEKYRGLCQASFKRTYRTQAASQRSARSSKHCASYFSAQHDSHFKTSRANIRQAGPTNSGKRIPQPESRGVRSPSDCTGDRSPARPGSRRCSLWSHIAALSTALFNFAPDGRTGPSYSASQHPFTAMLSSTRVT